MARNGINKRELDKWARSVVKETNKSLERAQRQNPPRLSAQLDATASPLPGGEAIESSGYLARLLLWLDDRAKLTPSVYIDIIPFTEELQLEDEDPAILALQLEQHDMVKILRVMGGDKTHVYLTDAGRVAVRELKNLQKNRAARLRHTMDAFLRWLFDTAGDQVPTNPALFLATPDSYFAGIEIPGTELHQALAYLAEHDLIHHIDTDPATVAITPKGVSCALSGGNVQDRTAQARHGATYNNVLVNPQGVIIGEQKDFTQNNTAGIDPSAFVQLAGYVGQISGTLGMSDPDRVELERVAQELHTEATSSNPEPGRMRQIATQLKDKLLEAGTTIAATMGVEMAEQALSTLMQ